MNKQDLITTVAESSGLSKNDATKAVEGVFDAITGALKNALDQAYVEWVHKPMAAMGYGGVGAARAVEHLRGIGVELQMAPIRHAVHLGGGELMKVHPMGQDGPMSEVDEVLAPSATAMLDDLVWWANATMAARAEDQAKAA